LKTDDSLGGSDRQLKLAGAAVWFESFKESLTKSLNAAMVTFVFGLERSSSAEQYPAKINLMDDQVLTMITVSYKARVKKDKNCLHMLVDDECTEFSTSFAFCAADKFYQTMMFSSFPQTFPHQSHSEQQWRNHRQT